MDSRLKGAKSVEAICQEQGISPATFYKWRNELEANKNEDRHLIKEL
ncbi:MAG TPA: transposase [Saprospiraceae bacterium]|nr:transposase [Saprospiraceae bacterium]HND88850.1 transposase [Saprospiraceae bacterium]HNG90097.1 transposase [Saprospiraceae bacterium]